MNLKYLVLVVLSFFMLASFASAANVFPVNVAGNSSTINPGSSFTVSFAINNSFSKNLTNIRLGLPSLSTGQWSSARLGANTLSIGSDNSVSLGGTKVLINTNSDVISLTFTSSSVATPSLYSGNIEVSGVYEGGSAVSFDLPVYLIINSISTLSISKISDLTLFQNGTINITNTGNLPFNNVVLSDSGNFDVSESPSSFSLGVGRSQIVTASPVDLSQLKFGTNIVTVTATPETNASSSVSFSIKKSFCKNGSVGTNISLSGVDIRSSGTDDTDWKLLDRVTVEVDVDNNNADDSISNVYVAFGLFDSNGKNTVKDLTFFNSDEDVIKIGTIKADKSDKVKFDFQVPADFKDGSYRLAVKTYSKESGLGEDQMCADTSSDMDNGFYQAISVDVEDTVGKYVAFDKVDVSPSIMNCGDNVLLTADVINVGEDDQDRVRVNLANAALGINQFIELRDLNKGDVQSVSFNFKVPDNAVANKTYNLELSSEYDYRNGDYRESSDDSYKMPLTLVGGCIGGLTPSGTGNTLITASLSSEAKAGQPMTVVVRITNAGSSTSSYIIGASGYESWSNIDTISDRVFNLAPKESKDVSFVFSVNKDASGEKSFVVEAISNGNTQTKEVGVNIAGGATGTSITSVLGSNYILWIIGAVNLILIVLIIFVAIRVSRR